MTIDVTLDELADNFEMLGDWDARYEYLMDLGKRLGELPDSDKTHGTQVHGCMSNVWVVGDLDNGVINYRAECDTAVIRGVIAILVGLYRGTTPDETLATDADQIFDKLGLFEHLSPTRHVGVYAIVERIRNVARGYGGVEVE
jgi:cysteine desulfuration protein SufE